MNNDDAHLHDDDPAIEDAEREDAKLREWGYPSYLRKACQDEFDYALGLRDGRVFHFCGAEPVSPDWVRIYGMHDEAKVPFIHGLPWCFDRGIEIRVADIMWVADAPNGS